MQKEQRIGEEKQGDGEWMKRTDQIGWELILLIRCGTTALPRACVYPVGTHTIAINASVRLNVHSGGFMFQPARIMRRFPLRRPDAAIWIGFAFANIAILFALAPKSDTPYLPVAIVILALLTLGVLIWHRAPAKFLLAFSVCSVCAATSALFGIGEEPTTSHPITDGLIPPLLGTLLFLSVATTLCVYRINMWAYAPLPLLVAGMLWVFNESPWVAVGGLILLLTTLALVNYAVMLVLDHSRDLNLAWKRVRRTSRLKATVIDSLFPIGLVVLLVAAGWLIHEYIERRVKTLIYAADVLELSEQGAIQPHDRAVRLDILKTLDVQHANARTEYVKSITGSAATGKQVALEVPAKLEQVFRDGTPKPLPDGQCERFHISTRLGSVGLRNQCRGLVASFSQYILARYNDATEKSIKEVRARANAIDQDIPTASAEAQQRGLAAIDRAYGDMKATTISAFWFLETSYLVGYVLLFTAIAGALIVSTARRVFCAADGVPFRITSGGEPKPLNAVALWSGSNSVSIVNRQIPEDVLPLDFCSYPPPEHLPQHWYVCAVGRKQYLAGFGFAGLAMPQPFGCLFQRARHGRLTMVRVDLEAVEDAKHEGRMPARLNVDAGKEVVLIRVDQGQEIVFRIASLIGFSEGVLLKSAYSTHVGLFLLGLGSFISYASGDGYLALEVTRAGATVNDANQDAIFEDDWLAFDRQAAFSVVHNRGPVMYWLSVGQLAVSSTPGSVLIAGERVYIPGIFGRVRQLLRYLMLPF